MLSATQSNRRIKAVSIRFTFKDGWWYLDVRRTAASTFRPDSRHKSLQACCTRAKEIGGEPEESFDD